MNACKFLAAAALTLLVGCEGALGDADREPGSSPSAADGDTGQEPNKPINITDIETADPETLPDGVPARSRVPRLSYAEYDRSVSDLLFTHVTPSDLFPAEQPNMGPFESGGERGVNERLLQEIVLAAEQLAAEAVADSARYGNIVGCEPMAADCRDSFLQHFGRRAYRRPLTTQELDRFQTLFDQGAEFIQSGDDFRDGVQLVVEAVLQSAKFLYLTEQGTGQKDESGTLLSDFEIASRLSYLFWGTGPDEELLEAAASGALSTEAGLAGQAERLALDARLRDRVLDFHDRWFQMDGLSAAEKDPTVFPSFSPELAQSMHAEMHAVVEEVTLKNGGGIVELLTTPTGAVDSSLASLYGLSGTFGAAPTIIQHPPDSGRKGLLTQAAFLTGHSSASSRTSPILRGVFVLHRLLCEEIPPPPPGAEMEEPDTPPAEELLTTRQYFEWKTSMTACASCHNSINPVGFAFENFGGIGEHRGSENGAPIDASGTFTIGGNELSFQGAAEFTEQLATLPRTRACYAINWLNYAYGRDEAAGDSRTLGRITAGLAQSPFGVREVLLTVTRGSAFNHLPPY